MSTLTDKELDAKIEALRQRKKDNAQQIKIADSDAGRALLERIRLDLAAVREGYHKINVDRDAVDVVRDLVVRITLDKHAVRDIEWLERCQQVSIELDKQLAAAHAEKAERDKRRRIQR